MAIIENRTYTTSDNKKFGSLEEAQNHEMQIAMRGQIDAFCTYIGMPLTVAGKEGKAKRNPGIKRVADIVTQWNGFLQSTEAPAQA